MRLWSLHPKYLDAKGLVALWREGLLARKVLRGLTKGYRHHPQLLRFSGQRKPLSSIDRYLKAVVDEAAARGYKFDRKKIGRKFARSRIDVTIGQLQYELEHLKEKLRTRDRQKFDALRGVSQPDQNPALRAVPGEIEPWEKRSR
jgi:Pyrimidine dimer DNA glycosylase